MSIYDLKPRFQAFLRPLAHWLYARGVTANQVTIAACVLSVGLGAWLVNAPRQWFALIPPWMFVRMAFNAIDGMLAREMGQKSALGAYLNELTDVVSDASLYLPFAFVPPFDWRSVGAVIFLAAVSEMTGVVAVMTGASRRYDGPMGKSDRAFVFSAIALWIAWQRLLPAWASWVIGRWPLSPRSPRQSYSRRTEGSDVMNRPSNERIFRPSTGQTCSYRHWPASSGPSAGAIVMFHRGHEHSAGWLTWSTSWISRNSVLCVGTRAGTAARPVLADSFRASRRRCAT